MKIHSVRPFEAPVTAFLADAEMETSSMMDADPAMKVAVLSGGRDKPYALGLTKALTSAGLEVDFIGGDEFDVPQLVDNERVTYFNLRGDQERAPLARRIFRVLLYYVRLIRYAATAKPRVFHILWNNKFEFFDRTLLMLYYRLLGKKIVFTAHNVNTRQRDGRDSTLNRFSLRAQYRLAHHIFVHTKRMREQLLEEYDVPPEKATRIPFGLNTTVPDTNLTSEAARGKIGLLPRDKAILFFGNIAPYKGLEFLVAAFSQLQKESNDYRLVIVGYPKEGAQPYWKEIERNLVRLDNTIRRIEYIPDEETEIYFKAADVVVLPYTHIFQSGVLFLGYNFGLPSIAADVGSLREEIVEGETGFVFTPKDVDDLARRIRQYFASDLYRNLAARRQSIRQYARERHSWSGVAETTLTIYSQLLRD